ncbi:DUF1156 domain-containing protein [Promethearchaeum syntrophicum]|uniref:DUF1156 domain-containing protein n=1 Tax=Promethearchaeum syntrophicum TaxID=2594042 RepID=A0A5B9D5V2_9ARCH|nr:DUF1156 domain-containing protein [Candidatus Prometheoarchaeum syntrophicum]QEE14508.1 hypothetical protein DSAG12_00321 [Candidatus Prometheoarchaeum syntrophicum]
MYERKKQRLIETFFPSNLINPIAIREKKGRPPIFALHYYWTRKPLAVIRPILLASILPSSFNHDEYLKLCGISSNVDEQEAIYKITPSKEDLELLKNKTDFDLSQFLLMDPFGGGGSIPFEALRYDLNVIVNEYNPLAWLILNATLKYPNLLPDKFFEDFDMYFNTIFQQLKEEFGDLFPDFDEEKVGAYIYCWKVICPYCERETPLISNWNLSSKKNLQKSLEPIIKNNQISYKIKDYLSKTNATCKKAVGICIFCKKKIDNSEIIKQLNQNSKEQLLSVISIKNTKGKAYYIPRNKDFYAIQKAKEIFNRKKDGFISKGILPDENMEMHTIRAAKYLIKWQNLFNSRQLLVICQFAELIKELSEKLIEEKGKKYTEIVTVYLSFLLGKFINRNSRLSTWDRPGEKIMHACSNKLNALQWDHSEINPFAHVSGSLQYGYRDVVKAIKFAHNNLKTHPLEILNFDFLSLQKKSFKSSKSHNVQLIITDPPYFDDAPYSELSEFFYVWYSRLLKNIFTENPNFKSFQTPKKADISVSHTRNAVDFDKKFIMMCKQFHSFLTEDGLLVMFFAHPKLKTWKTVFDALIQAKFHVTATWPVTTESKGLANVKKKGSLLSSLIIVARKITSKQSFDAFDSSWDNFEGLFIEKSFLKLKKLVKEGIQQSDLNIVALGIALEILTNPQMDFSSISIEKAILLTEKTVKLIF